MCWIVAIVTNHSAEAAHALAVSLEWLKHRGPDAVGALMYYDGVLRNVVRARKVDDGFLQQVELMSSPEDVAGSVIALGHTRYKTCGTHNPHNSQPFQIGHDNIRLELLFNGNIPNHVQIRREHMASYTFQTDGDTETLWRFLLHHIELAFKASCQISIQSAIQSAVKEVLKIFTWGYSVIGVFWGVVFAFKDPFGIRPMALWKKWQNYIFSSENHFYEKIGYEYIAELANWSLIFPGQEPIILLDEPIVQHPDVFEFVYLAKDSSCIYGVNNTEVRFDLGFSSARDLHEKHPDWEFDRVVAVPNGANSMRLWACAALGLDGTLPNSMTRRPHSDRSFLASEQIEREKIVRDKFVINSEHIRWQRILLIDDSIVRGTTMQVIVDMLLEAWASAITVISASPIVHYGDRYGIAMTTRELIGIDHTDNTLRSSEDIEKKLFYNVITGQQKARLFYPSVENFLWVFKKHGLPHVHAAYFDGNFIAG